jgi:nucleotide-binding universal stress UspA family protein
MNSTTTGAPTITVGVDGSPHAEAAMRWACAYAAHMGGQVTAISAWHVPNALSYAGQPAGVGHCEELRAKEALDSALGVAATTDVPVSGRVVYGHPSTVLLDASRHSDLLVVGALGLEAEQRVVLGSVSKRCALHAHCPVVVVPTVRVGVSRSSSDMEREAQP